MDVDLQRHGVALRIVLFLLAVVAGFFTVLLNAPPAHASGSTTSCGQAVCYVESTVRSESDWASEPYTGSNGETVTPGSGSGGSTQPKFLTKYVSCSSWWNSATGRVQTTYPGKDAATSECWMNDRTLDGSCPPQNGRASNGRVDYYIERVKADGSTVWLYARFKCVYPTDAYFFPGIRTTKVYTGGQTDFFRAYNATQAPQAIRTGDLTSSSGYVTRNVDLNNPQNYGGGWSISHRAQTGVTAAGNPWYGYYRLLSVLDYRLCQETIYPAWMGEPRVVDCSRQGQDTFVEPFTFACDTNPPLQRGVRLGALFDSSRCVPTWECQISGQTTVGGFPDRVTVLRNGQPSEVVFPTPTVRILDPARVRDVRNWQSHQTITPGSTPTAQYVKTSWVWDRWESYRPTGTIAFNWASTTAAQPFAWTSRYRFTANFLVPTQSAVDGSVSYVWVPDTRECLTSGSPNVDVVRSVNG